MNAHTKPFTNADWFDVGPLDAVPERGSRVVKSAQGDIAVFKAADGTIFAMEDRCPHKGGPLSQGIVHGHSVTCPLHNWLISLESGQAQGADKGCAKTIAVRVENGRIFLPLAMRVEAA